MNKKPTLAGILCVLSAAALWGMTGTIQGLLPSGREPVVVGTLRVMFGTAGLWAAYRLTAKAGQPWRELPRRLIAAAGAAIAGYNLFFFAGVSLAGVGVGTAIALGSGPVWVSLFEWIFSGHRPSAQSLVGQFIAILGLTVLVAGDAGSLAAVWTGYGLAALAGLSYGSYVYITGRIDPKFPAALTAAATFSVSGLLLLPSLYVLPTAWIDLRGLLLLVFLGLASTSAPFFLFTVGVRQMAASTAVTLSLAEPFTAWLLATVVLGEALTWFKVIGALIMAAGIRIVAGAAQSR